MSYQVTVVSHTHWDREWYRPFQEFRFQLVEVIDQLLDLLTKDAAFRSFLLDGQTIILEDYLEIRPEREAELRHHIQTGRIVIGPWHILPDEFLVSSEATVRNLLLADRISRRFGAKMRIGYTPDPFGHIGQLPQILAGFNLEAVALQRGLAEEPTELWWEAPDGTRLLLIFFRTGYGNLAWAPLTPTAFIHAVEREVGKLAPHAHTPHLLLMNGTDHMLPQPELPGLIAAANQYFNGKIHLEHASLPDHLAALKKALGDKPDLPVVRGELRSSQRFHLLPGVFSARMWIKQRNHTCQTLLEKYAEPLNAFAVLAGGKPRQNELWRAWRYLIENHPHDSICGCSVDQTHEEMRTRFDWSEQVARQVTENSLHYLASQIDCSALPKTPSVSSHKPSLYSAITAKEDAIVMVFNPVLGERSSKIELDVPWAGAGHQYHLLDEQGKQVPMRWRSVGDRIAERRILSQSELQTLVDHIESGFYHWRLIRDVRFWLDGQEAFLEMVLPEYHTGEIGNFDDFVHQLRSDPAVRAVEKCHLTIYLAGKDRLAFLAQNVPGVGYRTYRLSRIIGEAREQLPQASPGNTIENEYFWVSAHPVNGTLTIQDKRTGVTYQGLNAFEDGGDRGDEYTYCPPEHDSLVTAPAKPPHIECLDDGELGGRLRITLVYELPATLSPERSSRSLEKVAVRIISEVSLIPGVARVDIRTTVDNQAQDHRLRVLFPTPITSDQAIVDEHFDRLIRQPLPSDIDTSTWAEQPQSTAPQQAFVAVQNEQHGLLLANKGLPEYELIQAESGAIIALTLLRCIGWLSREDLTTRPGHAGPELPTPGAQCPGISTFEYSIIPFEVDLNAAARDAYAFEAPLIAVAVPPEEGTLPPSTTLISVRPAELVLTAIKSPENGEGLIVRFYNSGSVPVDGKLSCRFPVKEAVPINLLEEKIGTSVYPDSEGIIPVKVEPKRIQSYLLH
jgi:alpha-mannosidase